MNIVKKIPFPAVLAKIKMKNIFIIISALTIITPTISPTVSENYLDLFAKQDKSQEINSQSNSVMADNTTGNINNGETIDYNYPPASSLTLYIANAENVPFKMLTNKMFTNFVETNSQGNSVMADNMTGNSFALHVANAEDVTFEMHTNFFETNSYVFMPIPKT